jgi:ABC-type sugar transport system permease subunit
MPQPAFLLGQPSTALATVIVVAVCYGYPFTAAALLAGMQSIGAEYYEVARIEGASSSSFLLLFLLASGRIAKGLAAGAVKG